MTLNLYHVSQTHNDDYDTYSDFVCAAESEDEARLTHPEGDNTWKDNSDYPANSNKPKVWVDNDGHVNFGTWCEPELVQVKHIGIANILIAKGVICASFHAR